MGRFIAIEGGDGSGKATQAKILADYARSKGYDVYQVTFPRYGQDSAYYVEQYLNGNYGGSADVPAELGILPFALDRFAARDDIMQHLEKDNALVIADRYMASNLAHQGAKVSDKAARHEFYRRTLLTEYDILKIPRPDLNLVLLVPSATAQSNVDKKAARSYTDQKRDIHEADASHLDAAKRNYEEICELYPAEFIAITCTDADGAMLSIEHISQLIADQAKL